MAFEAVDKIDKEVMKAVANRRNAIVEDIAVSVSGLCSPTNVLIIMFLVFFTNSGLFQSLILNVAVVWVLIYSIKYLVSRERPSGNIEAGITASFPSAHSGTAFVLATVFSNFLGSITSLLYVLAFFVALSRIYLQTHYLSDVITGSLIGLGISLLI